MRTIKQFINTKKKVYFYLKDEETCQKFFQNAKDEELTFGGEDPTEKEWTDIIALLPNGNLCYVGWAGRICYHNATNSGAIRVDYAAYINGLDDYII